MAQTSGFLLGVDYSEPAPSNVSQIATDSSGALYMFSVCALNPPSGCVTKLSADGKTILWQNSLGFDVQAMAVDPSGGVYVIPFQPGDTLVYVAKLGARGTGIAWKTLAASGVATGMASLAADSQGRTYVAVPSSSQSYVSEVVRLNAAGSAVDYTAQIAGGTNAIAVDGSGAAYVSGYTSETTFLERLAPDGSAGFSVPTQAGGWLAVNANGDVVVYGTVYTGASASGLLQRFDSTGAITQTTAAPGGGSGLALDAAGNAYIEGASPDLLIPVMNSLATCGSHWIGVFAPDGSLLQKTYIPGAANVQPTGPMTTGPNSTVFVVVPPDVLVQLSPNANAQTFPLACLGNSATYATGPIAPGGFVTLFGNGLGPQQGVLTQASPQSPYPTQTANVQVTFDGTPAPLLWVQDQQVNVVAPWSLTPGQTTQVCVTYNTVKTNCLTSQVAQTAPAVFTVDGTYAAALNQDGTINSADNPAPLNSTVTVFATGLGPINPPQADGTVVGLPLPTNVLPVTVYSPFFTPIGAKISIST
jgi:uncharacterized protein (TIGR03437 family)